MSQSGSGDSPVSPATNDLSRPLGALDVFSIAAGAMISSGLFILPGLLYVKTGPAMIFAYLLAGVVMLPSALAQCELATAMPKAGGTYFFAERSLGPFAGTLVGFSDWFAVSFKSAFALVGMGAFAVLLPVSDLLPGSPERAMSIVAAVFCGGFIVLNLFSVKETGRLQVILVMALLAVLAVYVVAGITSHRMNVEHFRIPEDARGDLAGFLGKGWLGLIAATGMVFVSYGGLTKVANVSEEVRRPARDIPLGMIAAFLIVSVLYVAVAAVTVGVGTPLVWFDKEAGELTATLTPISDGARLVLGSAGRIMLSVAAILAFFTTANAGILAASRQPMAMSRDRLMPRFFSHVHSRFGTPVWAILATGAFMICVILFLKLDVLVKTASTLLLLVFVMVNLSLVVMRASRIHSYRPAFRAPGFPVLQVASILIYGGLISQMGRVPLLFAGGFAVAAAVWYLVYIRAKVRRRSALVNVVERIIDRKLDDDPTTLEGELKDILVRRDEIVEDRFDHLIKDCTVLDLEGPSDVETFFKTVACHASQHLHSTSDSLFRRLLERERESTTAIAPGLAIPHVIVQGQNEFDIILARCRKGIAFQQDGPPVHVVFVLLGSRDERSFHLKSLMWIAQIARNPKFRERWMHARNEDELRNIVLLAARDREDAG
jgi:amino acid transporter/mannitol/fructose-specific phosphotransferase system IIA component (Ntr-type)